MPLYRFHYTYLTAYQSDFFTIEAPSGAEAGRIAREAHEMGAFDEVICEPSDHVEGAHIEFFGGVDAADGYHSMYDIPNVIARLLPPRVVLKRKPRALPPIAGLSRLSNFEREIITG